MQIIEGWFYEAFWGLIRNWKINQRIFRRNPKLLYSICIFSGTFLIQVRLEQLTLVNSGLFCNFYMVICSLNMIFSLGCFEVIETYFDMESIICCLYLDLHYLHKANSVFYLKYNQKAQAVQNLISYLTSYWTNSTIMRVTLFCKFVFNFLKLISSIMKYD